MLSVNLLSQSPSRMSKAGQAEAGAGQQEPTGSVTLNHQMHDSLDMKRLRKQIH
jgi:hypothetical protein